MECTKESRVGWTSSAQLILNFSSPLITFFGKLRLSNIYFKKRKKERPWEVPSSWRHRGGGFWLLAPPPSASSLPNPISPSCRHQPFLSGILHFAPQYLSPTYFAPQSFQSPWILDLTLYQFRHAIQDCLGKKKKKVVSSWVSMRGMSNWIRKRRCQDGFPANWHCKPRDRTWIKMRA